MNATHARPTRVAWRDAEGSHEVPLGALHRIVARDPPLGLALLRSLRHWETARVVSGVWVTSRHFWPGEWARMQEVGYAGGGGDKGMWGSMGGGGVSDGEEGGKGGSSTTTSPNPPPSQAATQPPSPLAKKRKFSFEWSDESDDGAIPCGKKPKPPPRTPPPPARPTKAVPAPKLTNPPRTATAHPPPPRPRPTPPRRRSVPAIRLFGTVAHVPYSTGVQKGTVRGIHGRKYSAVWVEYPGGTTLCEVSRSLLFTTLEEAKRYREEARAGKKKAKPPAPTNEESNPPNANPTTEPTNPTNPTKPPSGPAEMWDPTTGSHEV